MFWEYFGSALEVLELSLRFWRCWQQNQQAAVQKLYEWRTTGRPVGGPDVRCCCNGVSGPGGPDVRWADRTSGVERSECIFGRGLFGLCSFLTLIHLALSPSFWTTAVAEKREREAASSPKLQPHCRPFPPPILGAPATFRRNLKD